MWVYVLLCGQTRFPHHATDVNEINILVLMRYFFFADYKDCLNTVYSAIEEADFLAIDGEFSGNRVGAFYRNGERQCMCVYA